MLQLADEDHVSRPVRVTVHTLDPISRAGVVSYLRVCPEISLADDNQLIRPGVAVLVAHALDATVLAGLSRLEQAGQTRVVLILDQLRESELLNVVSCGVTTILWRHEVTRARLCRAVLAADRGHSDLPPDLVGMLIGRLKDRESGMVALMPREVEVLRLVADGMDTGEIARELRYSERTIKNIVHAVTTRFQLRNRAHAVAFALRKGYL